MCKRRVHHIRSLRNSDTSSNYRIPQTVSRKAYFAQNALRWGRAYYGGRNRSRSSGLAAGEGLLFASGIKVAGGFNMAASIDACVSAPREACWPEGSGAESGFIRAVLALPAKPNTTVRFFERGDYYTVHGEDAKLAATEVFKTRALVRILGSG